MVKISLTDLAINEHMPKPEPDHTKFCCAVIISSKLNHNSAHEINYIGPNCVYAANYLFMSKKCLAVYIHIPHKRSKCVGLYMCVYSRAGLEFEPGGQPR